MPHLAKMRFFFYLTLAFLLVPSSSLLAQQNDANNRPLLYIKGTVREKESFEPIPKVNIEINGGSYTVTDANGRFEIRARKGDELVVRHKDFETIFYTIESDERISVLVTAGNDAASETKMTKRSIKSFEEMIDSAMTYRTKDISKSIAFVTEALLNSKSQSQNAEAYSLLGDVYMHWKQYDLAVTNLRISLQNQALEKTKMKLAEAYRHNKNYQESLDLYLKIKVDQLTNYQKAEYYEGLGNTYAAMDNYQKSIDAFEVGLKIAEQFKLKPKVTDLNSRIAETYSDSGNDSKARGFFSNSLKLAEKETPERAVEEKVKVAEFNNKTGRYSDEIELREEAIEGIEAISADSIITNESPATLQKQNYKIGNAYYLQREYDKAIPYLDKSIKEAEKQGDLVVKKDAIKKKSDVYERAGNSEKALEEYKKYTEVLDEMYIKREQEISQADRFRRNIMEQQSRITSLESDRLLNQSLSQERDKNQKLVIYALIGGLVLSLLLAFFMYKYIRQQRLANNLLALKSLRSQMNPHFIFNALNSVNAFIAVNDERTANKYLTDFSYLMRSVMENSEEDFIPLTKEIDLLRLYTRLEHFRFKDKFDYDISIDERIALEDYQIPPMLLQPYIENAVWHGLRYKKEKGHLWISIEKSSDSEINIVIADDGIGREQSKAMKTEHQRKHNSKGMGNIKKRIAILNDMYRDRVDVRIEDYQEALDAGTKVVVTLRKD